MDVGLEDITIDTVVYHSIFSSPSKLVFLTQSSECLTDISLICSGQAFFFNYLNPLIDLFMILKILLANHLEK